MIDNSKLPDKLDKWWHIYWRYKMYADILNPAINGTSRIMGTLPEKCSFYQLISRLAVKVRIFLTLSFLQAFRITWLTLFLAKLWPFHFYLWIMKLPCVDIEGTIDSWKHPFKLYSFRRQDHAFSVCFMFLDYSN